MKLKNLSPLRYRQQAGFSLVELMVSLTIGLVVILFVTSLYVSSKSGSRLQDDNTRLQEDGRAAMYLVGNNIKQAWFGQPRTYTRFGLVSNFKGRGFVACDAGFANPVDFADETCAAGADGNPAIQISYVVNQAPNTNLGVGTDCNGQTVPLDANGQRTVINRFYLAKGGDGTTNLLCAGNGNATPQPVLQNVEKLAFTYGVNAQPDVYMSPDYFTKVAAEALQHSPASPGFPATGFPAFKDVITVGVCMQVAGPNNVTQGHQTYIDCDGKQVTSADAKLRVVLQNTFTIRNNSAATVLAVE